MKYKYHLLKYKGKATRLTCPQCGRKHCFAPYVDDSDNMVSSEYGRCVLISVDTHPAISVITTH